MPVWKYLAALALCFAASPAFATDIQLFFPVPVQGKLSAEMQRLIGQFNTQHPDIKVTAVFTGSYDDTDLKTRAAISAGKPPAAAIMSANFIRQYQIAGQAENLDGLIQADGKTPDAFMEQFWPALKSNAVVDGHVFGVPFQNSTPLLYYSVDAFKQAGLDPDHPPTTWEEWVADAKKLTRTDGGQTTRYGFMMPGSYDYLGWITSALVMANGGEYYNQDYGGEVYYNTPTTLGALTFLDDMVHRWHVMPEGVLDPNGVTSAFFAGRAGMIILSTGALGFVHDGMKSPYKVAFLPKHLRYAAPIGGGSLIIPKGVPEDQQKAAWVLIKFLTSPEISGEWSRFTGYFAPSRAAYDLPEMKSYLAANPDAKVALDQLQYAQPWFATVNTVGVRKALEDQVQAMLSGRTTPARAIVDAQAGADALMHAYVEQSALHLPE
jgi:sn-glycerol 3-phosphate transport system substrate-binding protein